ncbi:MAG TPA: hypothetical protein PLQ69_01040 [Paludibacter sp.]|nr:hypothetical protein [Paludibacter sp.]
MEDWDFWDRPLESFDSYFRYYGFHKSRTEFFIAEFKRDNVEYNTHNLNSYVKLIDEQCIVNSGEYGKRADYLFKERLEKRLNYDFDESKRFIKGKINDLDFDPNKIRTYLRVVMTDLVDLINFIKSDQVILKYTIILQLFYQFVVYLFQRYKTFLSPLEFPIYRDAEEFLQSMPSEPTLMMDVNINSGHHVKRQLKKPKERITGFKWKTKLSGILEIDDINNDHSEIDIRTIKLYTILKKNKVILDDKITQENFMLAFNGSSIIEPLKIRWQLTTRGRNYKPSIVRVIKHTLMIRLGEIEDIEDRTTLATKLEFIFADFKGNKLSNFYQALSDVKDLSTNEIEKYGSKEAILINEIIKDFTDRTA